MEGALLVKPVLKDFGLFQRFFLILLGLFFVCGVIRAELSPVLSTATLSCDYIEFRSTDNVVIARDNAVFQSSGTRLEGDDITLSLSSQTVVAHGHVYIEDKGLAVLCDDMTYDYGATRGVLSNVFIQDGPWRIWGQGLERMGPDDYRIDRAAFTSCELNPPHYHFRGKQSLFKVKKNAQVRQARFALGDTPILYLPYYRKSFQNNPWTLTVDPGNSGRNGFFTKTALMFPVTDHSQGKLMWDYYSNAGHGFGSEYSYANDTIRGSASGFIINDLVDDAQRWNLRLGHWQQPASRWQIQSNVVLQSDQYVNDVFIGDDTQRVRQEGESDLALTYTGSWFTSRGVAEYDMTYSTTTDSFATLKTILPQWTFQTSSLRLGKSLAYFQFSGNARHQYDRPEQNPPVADPIHPNKDQFRQYADGTPTLKYLFRATKNMSLEPSVGLTQSWQSDQDLGDSLSPKDITQGKGFAGLNLRHRLTRDLDYDLTHKYAVRWTPNTFHRDHANPNDLGLEQNSLTLFPSWRPSSSLWVRASATYDFRDIPSLQYHGPRQRFSPPWVELNATPLPGVTFFARQTVQLYPVRKPQSTLFDFRLGKSDLRFFSGGFSYNVDRRGELDITHGAAFHLTPNWWLSGDVHYTAMGVGGVRYSRVDVKEKNLTVRRDLHCWVLRVTYRERPGSNELFFRLDLKTDLERRPPSVVDEKQFYPGRSTGNDF